MAILQPANQTFVNTGAVLAFTSLTSTDTLYFTNTGREVVLLNNASTSTTATFETPATVDSSLAIADKAVTVAATDVTYVGTFDPQYYNQSGTYGGKVKVTSLATVGVAIVSLPRV